MKALAFCAVAVFGFTTLHAQETLNWKGGISSDANNPENWDPVGGLDGNNITVGHVGTYATPETPNHPIISRDSEILFEAIGVSGPYHFEEPVMDEEGNPVLGDDGEPMVNIIDWPAGQLTVSMADGVAFKQVPKPGTYFAGTVIVKSGIFDMRGTSYFENNSSRLFVEGTGTYNQRKDGFFMIGNKALSSGGKIVIRENGLLNVEHANGIDRWGTNPEFTVTIQDNGKIVLVNNHVNGLVGRAASGQLNGGTGFYPHITFDVPTNKTTIVAKPANSAWIFFADRFTPRLERLLVGDEGSKIALEESPVKAAGTNFAWKYGTVSGGPYSEVLKTSATYEELTPKFTESGQFFLVCEVTTPDGTVVSNELQFQVASNKLVPSQPGIQYLRGTQIGGEVTMNVEGVLGAAEWKWTTTSGSGYQSFEPAITGVSIAPSFDEVGTYFVVLDAEVDGVTQRSTEIQIVKQALDAAALPLVWTGAVNDDFGNMFNWEPHAYANRNTVNIPVTAPHWPVFSAGTDTIFGGSYIGYKAAVMDGETVVEPEIKAQLIIRGSATDTLMWRNNTYGLAGILRIESGVFVKENDLLRLDQNYAEIQVTGTGVAIFRKYNDGNNTLCWGDSNTPSRGGQIYVSGQGKMYFSPAPIFRLTTNPDAAFSKFHLTEDAQLIFEGDFASGVAGYSKNNRFVLPEGHALKNLYDITTDQTYVSVRDLSDFSIANGDAQYISVAQNSEVLTLANVGSLENFTWKYSTSALGPWSDFATPIAGEQASVSFETPGTYYVAVEAGDGTLSSNVVKLVVIDFSVAVKDEGAGVYELSVVLPEGATASGWMVKGPEDTEYAFDSFGLTELTYKPEGWTFEGGDGEYLMSFGAVLKDEDDQDVNIMATPVKITIEGGEITSVDVTTSIRNASVVAVGVYPNPSTGSFTLNVNADNYVVEVVDYSGAVVNRLKLSGMSNTITINSKGIYLLKVITSEGVAVQRVIIK